MQNKKMVYSPLFFFFLLLLLPALPALPEPDPASIQPFLPTQAPPTTIPAFPEQSDVSTSCPLDLPDDLFLGIRDACGGQPRRSKCCPVLAAWIYSAYSSTALGSITSSRITGGGGSTPYDLPVLPDDSETCVDNLEGALKSRGIELRKPNETCDVVYCYCGIRLHPFNCPEAFSVSKEGRLVGDERVKKLETVCHHNANANASGCSKCLKGLHQLNQNVNKSLSESDRRNKMHNKDCELMGLTWLLGKNRTAYISTVSKVIRALMMSPEGSDPQSCSLTSDGMPLAVDSAELDQQSSSSHIIQYPILLVSTSLLYVCVIVLKQF